MKSGSEKLERVLIRLKDKRASGARSPEGAVDTTLRTVLARFPNREEEILGLMQASVTFRELCLDYGQAVESLDRVAADGEASDRDRSAYVELIGELEQEILETLTRSREEAESEG